MADILSVNPLPKGNAGGLIVRSKHSFNRVMWNVFMPPFQAEITVHIPRMPSRVLFDSKGMPLVISQQGGGDRFGWMLRAATRENGEVMWSPFNLANVYENAGVCWGNQNRVPTSFAEAWDSYWNSPFNADLTPRLYIQSYDEWIRTPEGVAASKIEHDKVSAKVNRFLRFTDIRPKFVTGQLIPITTDTNKTLHVRLRRIQSRRERLQLFRLTLRNRIARQAEIQFATPSYDDNDAYVESSRKIRIATDEYEATRAAIDRRITVANDFAAACTQMADAWSRHILAPGARVVYGSRWKYANSGAVPPPNPYYGMDRDWILSTMAKVAELANLKRHVVRSLMIGRFAEHLDMKRLSCVDSAIRIAYQNFVEQKRSLGLRPHFEGEWTKALVLKPMTPYARAYVGDYSVTEQFGPCDALIFVPRGMLPDSEQVPTIWHKLMFRGWRGARFSVYGPFHYLCASRIDDKLWLLSYPGVERKWVTNGACFCDAVDGVAIDKLRTQNTNQLGGLEAMKKWATDNGGAINVSRGDLPPTVARYDDPGNTPDDDEPDEPEEDDEPDEEDVNDEMARAEAARQEQEEEEDRRQYFEDHCPSSGDRVNCDACGRENGMLVCDDCLDTSDSVHWICVASEGGCGDEIRETIEEYVRRTDR